MDNNSLHEWEETFERYLNNRGPGAEDAAHDLAHIRRVVSNAKLLAKTEQADLAVVIPAAWLHDCIVVPKHSPDRSQASRLAAETASALLQREGFPQERIPEIAHAIHAHSFSAGIVPRSLEARVVQDADRLDALGAIGIARTLLLGGAMGSTLYDDTDPFARTRTPDDRRFVIDHFYTKLLRLSDQMQTTAGRAEAARRTEFMRTFLAQLEQELTASIGEVLALSPMSNK